MTRYCTQCGAPLSEGAQFCTTCGARVSAPARATASPVGEQASFEAAAVPPSGDESEANPAAAGPVAADAGDREAEAREAEASLWGASAGARGQAPAQGAVPFVPAQRVGTGIPASAAADRTAFEPVPRASAAPGGYDTTAPGAYGTGRAGAAAPGTYDPAAPGAYDVAQASVPAPAGPARRRALVVGVICAWAIALVVGFVVVLNPFGSGGSQPSEGGTTTVQLTSSSAAVTSSGSATAPVTTPQVTAPAATSAPATTVPATTAANGDYVLPDSATRAYSESDLSGLSDWQLNAALNEIYARHGRGFSDPTWREYFESKSWYHEQYTPEEFDSMPEPLNATEKANRDAIVLVMQERGLR